MTITHELEIGPPKGERFGLRYTENRVRTYNAGMVTINGPIPSELLVGLAGMWEGAFMDVGVAYAMGVSFAIIEDAEAQEEIRAKITETLERLYPDPIERWPRGLDVGDSAATIYRQFRSWPGGGPAPRSDVPRDGADFGRCLRLVRLLGPEDESLGALAQRDMRWAAICEVWDELERMYDRDDGAGISAKLREVAP